MRQIVVMEQHPNGSGIWVGKVGSEEQIYSYLKELEDKAQLDYLYGIYELKNGAEDESEDWLEFDDYMPVAVKKRVSA